MQKDPKQKQKSNNASSPMTSGKPSGSKQNTTPVKKSATRGKASKPTLMNVQRRLRVGGRTTIDYSKKVMSRFERFVEQEDSGRRLRFRISFSTVLIILIAMLLLLLLVFSNRNIVVDQQTVTIVGVSDDFEGYRILHLSDLHGRMFEDHQEGLLRAINNLSYDIVLLTGDMVGVANDPEPFYELLEGLGNSKPIYFIAGDSDPGPLVSKARDIEGTLNEMVLEDWILGAIRRGAIYLDRPHSLQVGSSTLWLTPASMLNINADEALSMAEYELNLQKSGVVSGIGVDYIDLPFTNYRYRQYSALKEAALYLEENDLHISLSHYPPSDNELAAALTNAYTVENTYLFAPDLVLCGHYCGGVWRLPGIGRSYAFYIPDALAPRHGWFPNQSVASGLRSSSSSMVYTSAGLGVTDYGLFPDFRFMNSPQISLITLTTKLTEDLLAG